VIRALVRYVDERADQTSFIRKALRYLFPDHWSFLLGEVSLYAFIVLVGTGIYLTLFFEPSVAQTTYHGSYKPLQGVTMSHAYLSTVNLSLSVKAGLLMRQTHHWAADVFIASIVLHVLRVFFTGSYRRPRELNYLIGLGLLTFSLLEGYLGYSMVDDLLSGMGLAIGYSVALSIPFVGANLAELIWGGPFPGVPAFWSRMYIAHVFLFPLLIAALLGLHLALIAARHHTQFKESPRESNRRIVGIPTFPAQTPRSLGLMFLVFGVLFLLGGLVQINPIWLWGPYHVADGTNGAQPDWYLGWLIGALRLVPAGDVTIGNYTLIPNPFWGGILFPTFVFGFLGAWPYLERRRTRDYGFHNIADRPRDTPWRTAIGTAFVVWVFLIFLAGSADRVYVWLGLKYSWQITAYRIIIWVIPAVTLVVTKLVCDGLRRGERARALQRAAEEAARTMEEPAAEVGPAV
jgi:ubiquinol-cytochrome c reductase cytochrome b subunit